MKAKFDPPPGWPPPPPNVEMGPDWASDPAWPPIPVGWQLFRPVGRMTVDQQQIQKVEEARRDEAIALGLQLPEAPRQETWMQKAMREAEEQKARKEQARLSHDERQLAKKPIGGTVRAGISTVGDRSSGVLACPKCGGAQFRIKRRGLVKGAAWISAPVTGGLSLAALAAPKSRVQCITCKTEYLRG